MAKHGKLWLASGNIWQHLATRVTACHYITEVVPEGYCVVFSGSKQSLGLGLQTSPMNYGTHGMHGSWAVEPCWSCDKLRLLPTLARRQRKPKSFLCTCLRTIVRSHFHGISWHGDEVSTEALNPLPRSLVTGSHWGITGIDAGCLRLGLSDQCPGRTDRPMSRQCCDTVERNKIPLIDLYLCKPCRLARVIENKAYPKRGFEWFLTFSGLPEQCVNDHWMIIEWFQCLCAPCAWASEHIRTSYSSHQQVQVAGELL